MSDEKQNVAFAIETRGDDVIIGSDEHKFIFTCDVAVGVANAILEAVQNRGYEVQVQTDARPLGISDVKRQMLITRCCFILRSLRGRDDLTIARQMVDTILVEIL